jgi:hypothetical protein
MLEMLDFNTVDGAATAKVDEANDQPEIKIV